MNGLSGCRIRLSKSIRVTHRSVQKTSTATTLRFWELATTTTQRFGSRNVCNYRARMTESNIKWTAVVVRKQFLEYFEQRGHKIGRWRGSFDQEDAVLCLPPFCYSQIAVHWTSPDAISTAVLSPLRIPKDALLIGAVAQCLPRPSSPTMTQPSSSPMLA